jgi:hypothetical protein
MAEQAEHALGAPDGDDEPKSELQLTYNSVRGYVSAIMVLWTHQVSAKLHSSPSPYNVAVKALRPQLCEGSMHAAALSLTTVGSPQSGMDTPQSRYPI